MLYELVIYFFSAYDIRSNLGLSIKFDLKFDLKFLMNTVSTSADGRMLHVVHAIKYLLAGAALNMMVP